MRKVSKLFIFNTGFVPMKNQHLELDQNLVPKVKEKNQLWYTVMQEFQQKDN